MNALNLELESAYRLINAGFRDVVRYRPEIAPSEYNPYRGRVWQRFGSNSPVYATNVVVPLVEPPEITVDQVDPPPGGGSTMIGYNSYEGWPTDNQLDAADSDDSLISLLPSVRRVRFKSRRVAVERCTVEELPYVVLAMTKTIEAIRS